MTKLKKLRIRLYSAIGIICLVAIVGIAWGVIAYTNQSTEAPDVLMENVNIETFNEAADVVQELPPDGQLGALSSPDIQSQWICVNSQCTYHITGSCADATTTLVSITNPFEAATSTPLDVVISGVWPYGRTGATSTIDMGRINITGVATTSGQIVCGPAINATAYPLSEYIIYSDLVGTSSLAAIENNVASSTDVISGGSWAKRLLTPTEPYLNCKFHNNSSGAHTDGVAYDGIAGDSNTFTCEYAFSFSRTRY